MEVYLGNPGEKFTAWCKANYGKPLPKDPSEGGVWTVTCDDYGFGPIKCSKYTDYEGYSKEWTGELNDNDNVRA